MCGARARLPRRWLERWLDPKHHGKLNQNSSGLSRSVFPDSSPTTAAVANWRRYDRRVVRRARRPGQ
eukprot:1187108-Prorocentrum_minimum.AAC.3